MHGLSRKSQKMDCTKKNTGKSEKKVYNIFQIIIIITWIRRRIKK